MYEITGFESRHTWTAPSPPSWSDCVTGDVTLGHLIGGACHYFITRQLIYEILCFVLLLIMTYYWFMKRRAVCNLQWLVTMATFLRPLEEYLLLFSLSVVSDSLRPMEYYSVSNNFIVTHYINVWYRLCRLRPKSE